MPWILGYEFVYGLTIGFLVLFAADFDAARRDAVKERWFTDRVKPLLESSDLPRKHFATWDVQHYLVLSQAGYRQGEPSCAFYPLWPMAVRGFATLTRSSHLATATILANAFSISALVVLYVIVSRRFSPPVGRWTVMLLAFYPGSLFLHFGYSEGLFLFLVALLWFALEARRPILACAAAFLIPLTRGVGLFLLLPLGWWWLMQRDWAWLTRSRWLREEQARLRRRGHAGGSRPQGAVLGAADQGCAYAWARRIPRAAELGLPLALLAGWGTYLGLMAHWTGNPFEGLEAQKYWKLHSVGNLFDLVKFISGFFDVATWHSTRGSLLDRVLFALLVGCMPWIRKMGFDQVLWSVALGLLPAMSGTFASYTRFSGAVFPLAIGLAHLLREPWARSWRGGVLAVFAGVHVVLLWRFLNFGWAG